MTPRRRTVSFDKDVEKGLRHYISRQIIDDNANTSFTRAINHLLREILDQKGYIENE